MGNPTAAMLVIGDEILSGRTRESNMPYLAGRLTEVGIDLKEVRVVSDDQEAIVTSVRHLARAFVHVFTSGGIGPTHDDITADCVAQAMGVGIEVRADARALLQAHYDRQGMEFNSARMRMARIPDGAVLIGNPVSVAPGFTVENVHVMAGVPSVFAAMVESLLPTLARGDPVQSVSVRLGHKEGDIAGPLSLLADEFAQLSFGSYPFKNEGGIGSNIVIRGTSATQIITAADRVRELFKGDIG